MLQTKFIFKLMNALRICKLKQQNGSTLIKVIVGVGLLAILATAAASVFSDSFSSVTRINNEVALSSKMAEILLSINRHDHCSKAFLSTPLTLNTDFRIAQPSGAGYLLETGRGSIKGFEVKSIRWARILTDPQDPTNILAQLEIGIQDLAANSVDKKEIWLNITKHPTLNHVLECQALGDYTRGEIYGRCLLVQNRLLQNIGNDIIRWPFVTCPGVGTGAAIPRCAQGFTHTILQKLEMNTDHGVINAANKVYHIIYGCVKI